MTEVEEVVERSPVEEFAESGHEQLKEIDHKLEEINLLIEQSQGEVDKLAQRNSAITAELHQLQAHFDTVPREDIRNIYEAAQDAQQRLFTMRGQLEKLQSDKEHLETMSDILGRSLRIMEGGPDVEIGEQQLTQLDTGIEYIIRAQEDERRKVTRLMHDGPAQTLSNFILQADIALRLFDADHAAAKEELHALRQSAERTFEKVRDFIFDLRPMMLDDLGLVPTVRRYAEGLQDKSGIEINLVVTGSERRIEPYIEVLAYRAIQEMLANSRDHAQATQIKVALDLDDNQVRTSVEDNGVGFDPEALFADEEYYGSLRTLRDRINQIGGTFQIDAAEAQGTSIAIALPTQE